ncbi:MULTISPECIES: BglG family transcription antiterminator [Liquorilactobacillus]|nr:PRD domain-containing protein [Liquorilactobacillus satsumensis]
MTIEYRQALINYLLKHRDFSSGSELSAVLNVSIKTISRTAKRINSQSVNRPIIESKKGRGYRLNYQNYLEQSTQVKKFVNVSHLTSVERRAAILKRLLVAAPQKHQLSSVFGKFYVSDSVISSDLKILRKMLHKYNLQLKRRNEYIWIEGKETEIRRAINDLLVTDDVISISHFLQSNQLIQQQDVSFVMRQLRLIEEQMNSEIPYPYNVNLFSHLYILIERYHNVGSLIGKKFELQLDEKAKLRQHSKETKLCKEVICNLNTYLNTQLPKIEIYYLYQYLTSSRVDNIRIDRNEISKQVREITNCLIKKVTENQQYMHINNQKLFTSLAKHMKPLLNRLTNNIKVKNNLLEQIKLEYPRLFEVVKNASAYLTKKYLLNPIDENEVGFITVYFAQAAENMRPPINIMVVCTTGFGTAQLLRAKIEKRFSELNIVKLVAGRVLNVEVEKHPEVDLVVSTIKLPSNIEIPNLVVSAMFTMKDQECLEQEVDHIRREMMTQ